MERYKVVTSADAFEENKNAIAFRLKGYGAYSPMGWLWMPKRELTMVKNGNAVVITVPTWVIDECVSDHNRVLGATITKA